MFRSTPPNPKRKVIPRPPPSMQDNLLTARPPGHFGHFAREPDSSYKKERLFYRQRNEEIVNKERAKQNEQVKCNAFQTSFHVRTDRRRLNAEIQQRTEEKMREYETQLVVRRNRLRDLLAVEEREFCKETVEYLQKAKSLKDELIKKKVEDRYKEKLQEQMDIVKEKRIQQHMKRCMELRQHLTQKHLIESKDVQLHQMRENESRRLSEKEWDAMWDFVMKKEEEAMMDREKQEELTRYNKMQERKGALNQQIRGKEMAKEEMLNQQKLDREEFNKMAEETKINDLAELLQERRKHEEHAENLSNQIKLEQKIKAERSKAESDLESAFNYLSQLEYKKEQEQRKSSADIYQKEVEMFRRDLKKIKEQRRQEQSHFEEVMEMDRKLLEEKQDDLKCRAQQAKDKLLQEVLSGRAEQLARRKEEAEREMQRKKEEDELTRQTWQTNKELETSFCLRKKEESRQRLEDWRKQIEYNKILKERERAEAERLLALGKQEEEKYRNQILETITSEITELPKHPFRKVLEQYDCCCESNKSVP